MGYSKEGRSKRFPDPPRAKANQEKGTISVKANYADVDWLISHHKAERATSHGARLSGFPTGVSASQPLAFYPFL